MQNEKIVLDVLNTVPPYQVYEGELNGETGLPDNPVPVWIEQQVANIPVISNIYIKLEKDMTADQIKNLSNGLLYGKNEKGEDESIVLPYGKGRNREIRLIQSCPSIDRIYQDKNGYTPNGDELAGMELPTGMQIFEVSGNTPLQMLEFFQHSNANASNPNRNTNAVALYKIIDTKQEAKKAIEKNENQLDNLKQVMQIITNSNLTSVAKTILKSVGGKEFLEDEDLATGQLMTYLKEDFDGYVKLKEQVASGIANDIIVGLKDTKKYSVIDNKTLVSNETDSDLSISVEGAGIKHALQAKKAVEVIMKDAELFNKFYKINK